jgi:hypothetical protein
MLTWDRWGALANRGSRSLDRTRLDAVADTLRSDDDERLAAGFTDPDFRVPDVITSMTPPELQPEKVTLRPV